MNKKLYTGAIMQIIQQDLFEPSLYLQTGRQGYFSILVKKLIKDGELGSQDLFHVSGETEAEIKKKLQKRLFKQTSYPIDKLAWVIDHVDEKQDTWISQGVFRTWNRRVVNLDHLGLCFVDLDTYNISELKRLNQREQLTLLLGFIESREIPPPSIVVFSGRGFQVKWLFEKPIPKAALPRWNAIQRTLVNELQDLGADKRARDASRVLRLERTVNTKSGEITRVVSFSDVKYDFDLFADQVLPMTRDEFHRQVMYRKNRPVKIHKVGQYTPLNISSEERWQKDVSWKRVVDLMELRRIRYGDGGSVKEGSRDLHLTWETNFLLLSDITRSNQMYYEARALKHQIDPNWSEGLSVLSTLYQKAMSDLHGGYKYYRGKSYPNLYTPTNNFLIDNFEISREEQKHMLTIFDSYEHNERDKARKLKKARANGVHSRDEYEVNSLSRQKPWEKLGMSRRTWYRKGKPSKN